MTATKASELDRLRRLIVYQAEQNRKLAKENAKLKKVMKQAGVFCFKKGDRLSFTSTGVEIA